MERQEGQSEPEDFNPAIEGNFNKQNVENQSSTEKVEEEKIDPMFPGAEHILDMFDEEEEEVANQEAVARQNVEVETVPDPMKEMMKHQASHPNPLKSRDENIAEYQRRNASVEEEAADQRRRHNEQVRDAARARKIDARNARLMHGLTTMLNKIPGVRINNQ